MYHIRFFPLALLISFTVSAVPLQVQNAGGLDNILRQQSPVLPPLNNNTSLVLPTAEPLRSSHSEQNSVRVRLSAVMFNGDIAEAGIPLSCLQASVADLLNTELSFSGLQKLANRVTALYRREGFLVARAVLPPQTIKNGVLQLRVVIGHYAAGQIKNASTLRTSVVQRIVSTATPEGGVIRLAHLEREALLLSELPGVNAHVSLLPGTQPGTSSPTVDLTPGARIAGYAGLDNQGNEVTGRSRAMAGLQVNNPLGLGDQLNLELMDAWENSDLFNGSIGYSVPVNGYGTRMGVVYSHLNYHYSLLQNSFSGYSDNWTVYASHPWIRTATARVDIRLEGGQQFLTDKYPHTLFGPLGSEGRKQVSSGSLGVTGSVAVMAGGVSGFMLKGTTGDVDYRNALARLMGFSEEAGTAGHYSRLNWLTEHEQSVWGPVAVYGRLSGQFAAHNLDSSQKLLLGGPMAVRAYDSGDGSVNEGTLLTTEVRSRFGLPLPGWAGAAPSLTVASFFDQGWGKQYDNNRPPSGGVLTSNNRVNLSGAGLYTTLGDTGNYALTLTWAHRTGNADPVSGSHDKDRFWISAVKSF
ncbi:ShlB/FhaC/HecB family hemolysin secretion/activation protein [Citrobacter braakii]